MKIILCDKCKKDCSDRYYTISGKSELNLEFLNGGWIISPQGNYISEFVLCSDCVSELGNYISKFLTKK